MKQFGKMMLLAFGFGLLAVVLSSIPNHSAAAPGSAPVTVVGGVTGATPVPVSLQGTGNISGNVNAAQSGAWNVGVNNFPSTQSVSATQSGTWSVGINNASTSPVPVRDVENPGRHSFQEADSSLLNSPATRAIISFPLDPGQLLVIETVSVGMSLPSGQKAEVFVNITQGGVTDSYLLPLQLVGNFSSLDDFQAIHLVRLYADPGTTVKFVFDRDSGTGNGVATASISGYVVNCGSGSGCPLP